MNFVTLWRSLGPFESILVLFLLGIQQSSTFLFLLKVFCLFFTGLGLDLSNEMWPAARHSSLRVRHKSLGPHLPALRDHGSKNIDGFISLIPWVAIINKAVLIIYVEYISWTWSETLLGQSIEMWIVGYCSRAKPILTLLPKAIHFFTR